MREDEFLISLGLVGGFYWAEGNIFAAHSFDNCLSKGLQCMFMRRIGIYVYTLTIYG